MRLKDPHNAIGMLLAIVGALTVAGAVLYALPVLWLIENPSWGLVALVCWFALVRFLLIRAITRV